MKKLIGSLFFILCVYVIYFDLTQGTLPVGKENYTEVGSVSVPAETKANVYSVSETHAFKRRVTPGDTVLTIIEHQLKRPIPVSIDEIISDFTALNPGISPEKIQSGKVYRFPDYSK